MNFSFTCWSAFLLMGGYAFYVWTAVIFTLVPLMAPIVQTLWQQQAIRRDIVRQQRGRKIRNPLFKEERE